MTVEHLLPEVPNRLVVIGDGAPMHRTHTIQEFLTNGASPHLHLEHLPAYAPELNPDESVRAYVKGVELRNLCGFDEAHLRHEQRDAVKRLRRKPRILRSGFQWAGL